MKTEAFRLQADAVQIEESALPPPVLTYDTGTRRWRLESDYSYRGNGVTITVPDGFQFDLSSIPRPLWWLIAPFELSISAPLLHDFLYQSGGNAPHAIEPDKEYTRSDTDALFKRIMEQEGVAGWRRGAAYLAVRVFGGFAWRD